MQVEQEPRPPRARRRNRGWIVFFVGLFGLTVALIAGQVWFSLEQQLSPEFLGRARALWDRNQPATYRMTYTIQHREGDPEQFVVWVRDRKPVGPPEGTEPLEQGTPPYQTMEELFQHLDDQLQADQRNADGPRVYRTATCDKHDGHLIRYVRSVRATREREEINVKLQKTD